MHLNKQYEIIPNLPLFTFTSAWDYSLSLFKVFFSLLNSYTFTPLTNYSISQITVPHFLRQLFISTIPCLQYSHHSVLNFSIGSLSLIDSVYYRCPVFVPMNLLRINIFCSMGLLLRSNNISLLSPIFLIFCCEIY